MAAATQTVDLDEALVRRFVEASWNGGLDSIGDLVSPDYVGYGPDRPEDIHGREELEEYVSEIRSAFTDPEVTIGVVVAAGDTVWATWRATGTNDGGPGRDGHRPSPGGRGRPPGLPAVTTGSPVPGGVSARSRVLGVGTESRRSGFRGGRPDPRVPTGSGRGWA